MTVKSYKFLWKSALILLTALLLCLFAFWQYLPYQGPALHQLRKLLQSYGLIIQSLEMKQLDSNKVMLSHIALGETELLTLEKLALTYQLPEIITGKLRTLEAEKFHAIFYQKEGIWQIGGLEALLEKKASETVPSNQLQLFDKSSLERLLPEHASVKKGLLTIKHADGPLTFPVDVQFTLHPKSILTVTSPGIRWDAKPYQLMTGALRTTITFNEQARAWEGNLSLPAIHITGLPVVLPPLTLTGHFSFNAEKFQGSFRLIDKEKTIQTEAVLSFPFTQKSHAALTLKNLLFPWGKGTISASSITIPLGLDKPVPVSLHIQNVELSSLLSKIHEQIKSTGTVSGTFPFTYHPDGHITLQEGKAENATEGFLYVPPSLLPGDNQQLAIARTALENFHYTTLKITAASDTGRKSLIRLALEGKNPEAFNGRPVHLNITLTGDLLPFIEQSILPFHKLKKLINLKNTP